MKSILYLLFFSLFSASLYSQTMFAPPGSEWYHLMGDGVFHSYYAGDTVISGIACRKIVRNAFVKEPEASMGLHVSDLSTLYVYNTTDTVFVYNTIFSRFTPLYLFNVTDGDTVRLPILPNDIGQLQYLTPDSSFSFRVGSVRMILYDTATLKTVYTHGLGDGVSTYQYNFAFNADSTGAYAERIGAVGIGFMPFGRPAVLLTTESAQPADSIRCYTDPTLSIHLVSGICGLPSEQVPTPTEIQVISVTPNPSDDQVTITNLTANAFIELVDMAGRVVMQINAGSGSQVVPVSQLQTGIYILRITQPGMLPEFRKISVVH